MNSVSSALQMKEKPFEVMEYWKMLGDFHHLNKVVVNGRAHGKDIV
jgi:hypothetical protein